MMMGKVLGAAEQQVILEKFIKATLSFRMNAEDLLSGTDIVHDEIFKNDQGSEEDLDILLSFCGIPEENLITHADGHYDVDHPDYFCRDYYYQFIKDYYPSIEVEFGESAAAKLIECLRYMAKRVEEDFDEVVEEALDLIGLEPLDEYEDEDQREAIN